MIKEKGDLYLDIREFLNSDRFHGYTTRGLFLSAEEWDALIAQRKKISKLLAP